MYATSKTYNNLALFDFDGTLCNKDSFTGFIFYALSKRHIVKQGLKILPWIQAYYLRLYPAHAMRPRLFQSMFKDISVDVVEQLAQEYAQKLTKKLDPDLFQPIELNQRRGDLIFLDSSTINRWISSSS